MGVYNNNKDGTRSTLANTIQVVDAPMEQFLSRGEFNAITPNDVGTQNKLVAENEVTKAYDTMPTASADLVGTIVQYVGTTTANYTNGYFYKCVSDGAITPTYSWVEVEIGDKNLPFVTPEQFGAKGDGVTDDTEAFTSAFAASKNVICDGTKTYYFAGIVDASDLTDGDFNINNATLLNFHIKVGIKNTYEPKVNYPYLSFKIHNGNIGTYSAIPANWQTPAIQTGNAIDLDNIVFKNTPYIVALTNSYRDYNKFRNLTFDYYSSLWADVASWDLDAISLIASDGSFVKINSGSVNTGIPSTTGKFSGDGWIIENVCQFISGKYTNYGFCHFYNNHTLNINRCVQTKFYFGTGTRVEVSNSHFESLVSMPVIETLSDATGTVGTTNNIQVDFDNCYFTDHYTLECDKNYVTYTNCYFRVAGDATDKTIPLATVFKNYDYYNMECSIADSLLYRMPMNTNKWKGYKEQAKLTRNFRNNTSNESTMTESIQATKSIGSGDYKYPQTGTYNYVGFSFTNSAEIAHERYEWTRTVSSLSSAGDGSSTMVGLVGGWGFEIYRTLPDSTIQRARFYDSPIEENYKTVTNKQFAFRERGNYIIIHKWTIFSPSSDYVEEDFYIPWCTVSAIPSYTVNNQVYEKNGVLVTLDRSIISGLTNKPYAQVSDDYLNNTPRYNVLDYGLKGDNSTDNSDAFETLLAELPRYGTAVIYFPQGRYRFSRPIVINDSNGVTGITLIGDTVVGKSYDDGTKNGCPDSTLIYTGDANTTFIKGGSNCWYFNVHGLHLTCIDGFNMAVNDAAFSEIPYNVLVSSVVKDNIVGIGNVNGIDVSNCVFSGFSGSGVETAVHTTVKDCSFFKCKVGIDAQYDNIINDCWFNYCGTAIIAERAGSRPDQDWSTLIMNDTWIDQCTRGIYCPAGQIALWLVGIMFDMFDEAAILCDGKIFASLIVGHIQRAGMKYADLADADRTTALAPETDAIVASQILNTKIDIVSRRRNIGKSNHSSGMCPSRLVNATTISDSSISNLGFTYERIYDPDMVTLTNSSIYASDKIMQKELIMKSDTLPTASANELGNTYMYMGATDVSTQLIHGAIYECVSDGAATPTYSWKAISSSIEGWKIIVSQCNDFTEFKNMIESL